MIFRTDTTLYTPRMWGFKKNKNEMGIPYIYAQKTQDVGFIKTVWEKFERFTKKEIAVTEIVCKYQGMIGHPYERLQIHGDKQHDTKLHYY